MSENYERELHEFEKNGYVFVPHLLSDEETALVFLVAKSDTRLMSKAFGVADTQGGVSLLSGWNQAGDDVYGMVVLSCVS